MKKIIAILTVLTIVASCSGHIKCGYMLDAEGSTEWSEKKVNDS